MTRQEEEQEKKDIATFLKEQKDEEKKAEQFAPHKVDAFRVVSNTARSLDDMVGVKMITPDEATARLLKVLQTKPDEPPAEAKEPPPPPKGPRAKAVEEALKVPDPVTE